MKEIKSVTWITKKNGKIGRVQAAREGDKPVPENLEWHKAFCRVTAEESLDRYEADAEGNLTRRRNDEEYLEKQGKKSAKGKWYHKKREKQDVEIYNIDALSPGDDYTQEPPLENEQYQYFDEKKKKWVVDEAKKEKAKKDQEVAEIQSAIDDAERRIQRSTRAKLDGTADEEDERYFTEINAEIKRLRKQKQDKLSA